MPYCTVAEAIAAGADGDNTEITAAIDAATERIDRFCREWFEPRSATVIAEIGLDGIASLSRRVQSIDSVTTVGASSPWDASTYTVRTAEVEGDIDAIDFGAYGRFGRSTTTRLEVAGSFGWAAPPASVKRACALIAAAIMQNPEGDDEAGYKRFGVEGYTAELTDAAAGETESTGVLEADQLLRPYRRRLPAIA